MTHINKKIKEIQKLEILANKLLHCMKITHGLGRALRLLLKETTLYKNHLKGLEKLREKRGEIESENIQIGGGQHILRDFLNIDIVPPADILFDVREGLPLKSNSSKLIFAEHFLEHLDYPISAKKFINECFRVLKRGGKLILGVPNSRQVILAYIKKDKNYWKKILAGWYSKRNCREHFNTYIDLVNYHFRDQDDDFKYNPHFWAYDFEKLKSMVKTAGFRKVKKWKFDFNIANPKRKWGSIYIEAIK